MTNGPGIVGWREVARLAEAGAQIVEVLPQEEYRAAHLPGAVNIPLQEFHRERLAELRRDSPVVVYCADSQ